MNEFKDLVDRTEFTTKEGTFVEESLCVKCPECGLITTRIVTGKARTFYVHSTSITVDGNSETYCEVQRGQEHIDDAIMYAKAKDVELHDLVVSTAVRLW